MEKFVEFLNGLENVEFKVSRSNSGVETIQATQRNKLKQDLTEIFFEVLKEKYPFTFRSGKGILLDVSNSSVADSIENEEGSGGITVRIEFVIPSLSTDPSDEEKIFLLEEEAKSKLKAEKEALKKAKIQKDMAARAEKKRLKDTKINQLKEENKGV